MPFIYVILLMSELNLSIFFYLYTRKVILQKNVLNEWIEYRFEFSVICPASLLFFFDLLFNSITCCVFFFYSWWSLRFIMLVFYLNKTNRILFLSYLFLFVRMTNLTHFFLAVCLNITLFLFSFTVSYSHMKKNTCYFIKIPDILRYFFTF